MSQARRLGTFHLRNPHTVYQTGTDFVVVQSDRHGVEHRTPVSPETVNYLCGECRGETVTAAKAASKLGPVAHCLQLPYSYGYKLEHYARAVLLVLVAIDQCTFEKRGRGYYYWMKN